MALKHLMWHYVTIEKLPEGAIDTSGAVDRFNWQPVYQNIKCNIQTLTPFQRENVVVEYLTKETKITHLFFIDKPGLIIGAGHRLVTAIDYRDRLTEAMIADREQCQIYQVIGFGEPVRKRSRQFSLREVYAFRTNRWMV